MIVVITPDVYGSEAPPRPRILEMTQNFFNKAFIWSSFWSILSMKFYDHYAF